MVAAIVAGDPAGLSAAFDRYAAGLFGYCQLLLTEPADAADAVQDTFVIAAAKAGALRDPDRLRPWLYAVARNECRRRLRAVREAPLDGAVLAEVAELNVDPADLGAHLEQAELRELVQAALHGLSPGEREIIELSLGHELAGADLADALGVPRNQAHVMASRARAHFEAALGVLLVARSGQEACPGLAAILDGWDGRLTVLLRKRVTRHIRHCPGCGARQRREMNPESLLSLLPAVVLPASLRHQVLSLLADPSPAAAARRLAIGQRIGPLGPGGFPRPLDPPGMSRLLLHPARAGAGAAGAAAVIGGTLLVLQPWQSPGAARAGAARPVGLRARGEPGRQRTAARPGDAAPVRPAPAASASAPSGPGPAAGHPSTGTTGAAGPGPAVSVTVAGRLVIAPASLTLRLSLGSLATGTVTLTAVGGPVAAYHVTVPALFQPGLSVSQASGSLAAGHSVRLTVSAAARPAARRGPGRRPGRCDRPGIYPARSVMSEPAAGQVPGSPVIKLSPVIKPECVRKGRGRHSVVTCVTGR